MAMRRRWKINSRIEAGQRVYRVYHRRWAVASDIYTATFSIAVCTFVGALLWLLWFCVHPWSGLQLLAMWLVFAALTTVLFGVFVLLPLSGFVASIYLASLAWVGAEERPNLPGAMGKGKPCLASDDYDAFCLLLDDRGWELVRHRSNCGHFNQYEDARNKIISMQSEKDMKRRAQASARRRRRQQK